jgi:hypothetical protein
MQAVKLVEPFPFQNPFQLTSSTELEKKGILLRAFRDNDVKVSATLSKTEIAASLANTNLVRIIVTRSGSFSYVVSKRSDTSTWLHVYYGDDQKMQSNLSRNANQITTSVNSQGVFDIIVDGTDIKLKNMWLKKEVYKDGKTSQESFDNYDLRTGILTDIDTDNSVGYYDDARFMLFVPILPEKPVRAGEQWEK